jgi:hypothetical protein
MKPLCFRDAVLLGCLPPLCSSIWLLLLLVVVVVVVGDSNGFILLKTEVAVELNRLGLAWSVSDCCSNDEASEKARIKLGLNLLLLLANFFLLI